MTMLAAAALIIWLISFWCLGGGLYGRGLMRRLRRLITAAVFASLGALLTTLLIVFHAFHAFSGETLIAQVSARRLSPEEFELTYAPAGRAALTVRLRGDQWVLSGGVVKWHPWLTAFGLDSYHKPMRLSGQFSDVKRQRSRPPTVAALEPEGDQFWELLYRFDPYLPFVEAVYGSSAYVYVEPGLTQEVYVTSSGYLIKRKTAERMKAR